MHLNEYNMILRNGLSICGFKIHTTLLWIIFRKLFLIMLQHCNITVLDPNCRPRPPPATSAASLRLRMTVAVMMVSVSTAGPWIGVLPTRPSSDNVNFVLSFLIVNIAERGPAAPLRRRDSLIRETNSDRSHRTRNILGQRTERWELWAGSRTIL